MATRSRHGCIDCKRAKVKCDEIHPSCGTCKRRGRQCSGYTQVTKAHKARASLSGQTPSNSAASPIANANTSEAQLDRLGEGNTVLASPAVGTPMSTDILAVTPFSPFSTEIAPTPVPQLFKKMANIPPGTVHPSDEPFIELYFTRHPTELVFGSEFVNEMNSCVLKVFQNSPMAVGDSLSAIGEAYLKDSKSQAVVPVPNRRARILARLRNLDTLGVSLELLLTVMLGLCAVELIDTTEKPEKMSALPSLLDNLSMMLDHHINRGFELTQLSKYFIRALARQDMMISLVRFHRPRIPTSYWLDDHSKQHADRFMGYTGTLMPILGDLCALAEDIRTPLPDTLLSPDSEDLTFSIPLHDPMLLVDRATQLQSQLELWHPTVDPTLSFHSSRKFLMHANAYRSAALLYLHRLIHPAGSSVDADQAALIMAYEVMVHTTGEDDDLKMSLWPIFLAACEVSNEADRMTASYMLGAICRARKTVTSTRTRAFVINRVWHARDNAMDWNWMTLCEQYPNDLIPI